MERLKRAAKTREEFKKANEDLLQMQAQMALKEKEEELRIQEREQKKEALKYLQKTKEEERFKHKQAIKQ
jgi:hypothetical protein